MFSHVGSLSECEYVTVSHHEVLLEYRTDVLSHEPRNHHLPGQLVVDRGLGWSAVRYIYCEDLLAASCILRQALYGDGLL